MCLVCVMKVRLVHLLTLSQDSRGVSDEPAGEEFSEL